MAENLPGGAVGKELKKTLAPGEQVLAHASGKGGATLVATDRRALIIKTGAASTGTWFGRKCASYGYPQITSLDLHTSLMDGYVQISTAGVTQKSRVGRYTQLIHADNICPFNKPSEGSFRRVVEVIREHLYAWSTSAAAASPAANRQTIPEQIAALAQLRDAGVLSASEFEAKKVDLLSRM